MTTPKQMIYEATVKSYLLPAETWIIPTQNIGTCIKLSCQTPPMNQRLVL